MDLESFWIKVFGSLKEQSISSSVGRIYLIEQYETEYGIHDHNTSTDSFNALLMQEAENPLYGSGYQKRMRQYKEKDVLRIFGLDFVEFLNLPCYLVDEILDSCDETLEKEHSQNQERLRQMEAEKNNPRR